MQRFGSLSRPTIKGEYISTRSTTAEPGGEKATNRPGVLMDSPKADAFFGFVSEYFRSKLIGSLLMLMYKDRFIH